MSDPSFSEVYLKKFTHHNPHCKISVEEGCLVIGNPWGIDDARIKINTQDQEFIKDLNNIRLNPKFDAVFHDDTNTIEFIWSYLNPEQDEYKEIIDRKFLVHFSGEQHECYFAAPTSRLFKISNGFERLHSDTLNKSVPQIKIFKDSQRLDKCSENVKEYFKGKVPRNFFIKSNSTCYGENLDALVRHINFLLSYYDRHSPTIAIHHFDDSTQLKDCNPIRQIEGTFPAALSIQPVDDIVLKLMEVAKNSQSRFAFLYYYQIFEYAGYYYIDGSSKRALRNYLKDPALINCEEGKISELFSLLSESNQNDDVKMKNVIQEYCDPSVIWKEIENDKDFFSTEHSFQGGFELKPLIAMDTTEATWKAMWMPKLYDHFTKIRNSLVHARERRENKVILPSKANNKTLNHYIPIIRRVAEQIALKV